MYNSIKMKRKKKHLLRHKIQTKQRPRAMIDVYRLKCLASHCTDLYVLFGLYGYVYVCIECISG